MRARLALNNFQFSTENLSSEACDHMVVAAGKRGVPLKVFTTSTFQGGPQHGPQYVGVPHSMTKAFSIGIPPRLRGRQLDKLVDALLRAVGETYEAVFLAVHEGPHS